MDYQVLDQALAAVQRRWRMRIPQPDDSGVGWSEVAGAFTLRDAMPYTIFPLGATGVVGMRGVWPGGVCRVETFIFQGRRHWYEGWAGRRLPFRFICSEKQGQIVCC
jgi:hypothetical protein